jgi:hypothetical protein
MTGFDNREKGFEAKFSHDEDTKFRIRSRRNKLLGLWVAKAFGLSGAAADSYAADVVASDMDRPGDDDMIEKIMADVAARGAKLDVAAIKKELAAIEPVAREQILADKK